MKTAVSVPSAVFQAGKAPAPEDEITRRLNEIYDASPAELDPVLIRIASRVLPEEAWN